MSELILKAATIAAQAHAGQCRKGLDDPYINHPLRVSLGAQRCGLSEEAVVAALLHDVVEDTTVSMAELRAEFSERVIELVTLLTKWWPDDAPVELKKAEKPRYYGAVLRDREAISLKLLDRADNLQDMRRMLPRSRAWAQRYLKKTRVEFAPVHAACDNPGVKERFERAIAELEAALGEPASKP